MTSTLKNSSLMFELMKAEEGHGLNSASTFSTVVLKTVARMFLSLLSFGG